MSKLLWTMLDREFVSLWRNQIGLINLRELRKPMEELSPANAIALALSALEEAMAIREKQDLAGGGSQ